MKNKFSFLAAGLLFSFQSQSQCVTSAASIYSFNVNGQLYEIVKENLDWVNASACAVARGGWLAEINSAAEQDTLFYHINQAGITAANTVAPDGGGASYLWLGGNDLATEGQWRWDGANTGNGTQFWQGTSTGSVVGGLYTNWGNEPDNWNGQDALGFAFINWPLGTAGQWNDVDETNQLYYVIEHASVVTALPEPGRSPLSFYPQPAQDRVYVKADASFYGRSYTITDPLGKVVASGRLLPDTAGMDLGGLPAGMYLVAFDTHLVYRLLKQ